MKIGHTYKFRNWYNFTVMQSLKPEIENNYAMSPLRLGNMPLQWYEDLFIVWDFRYIIISRDGISVEFFVCVFYAYISLHPLQTLKPQDTFLFIKISHCNNLVKAQKVAVLISSICSNYWDISLGRPVNAEVLLSRSILIYTEYCDMT